MTGPLATLAGFALLAYASVSLGLAATLAVGGRFRWYEVLYWAAAWPTLASRRVRDNFR